MVTGCLSLPCFHWCSLSADAEHVMRPSDPVPETVLHGLGHRVWMGQLGAILQANR